MGRRFVGQAIEVLEKGLDLGRYRGVCLDYGHGEGVEAFVAVLNDLRTAPWMA